VGSLSLVQLSSQATQTFDAENKRAFMLNNIEKDIDTENEEEILSEIYGSDTAKILAHNKGIIRSKIKEKSLIEVTFSKFLKSFT
jgi:hypothetical protein